MATNLQLHGGLMIKLSSVITQTLLVEEVGKAIIQLLNQGSVVRSRAGAKPD